MEILGAGLIALPLIAAIIYVTSKRPNRKLVLTACIFTAFFGCFLVVNEEATEITVEGVGTIKATRQQAEADAEVIADFKERVEGQAATVDLVAQQATKALALAEETATQISATEQQLTELETALTNAKDNLDEIQGITEFTRTVISAQNDDRLAFDQLQSWMNDPSYDLSKEAASAWNTILDLHNPSFVRYGFSVPWIEGLDPSTLSLAELIGTYPTNANHLKLGFIEYVWGREDIPEIVT